MTRLDFEEEIKSNLLPLCLTIVAMVEILTAHIVTNKNPVDLATKIIYSGQKRSYLVSKVLHDIYD